MKDNKLIAEFIGMQHTNIGWYDNEETLQLQNNTFDKLQFHTSWDWLMPVVEKVLKMKLGEEYDIRYLATHLVNTDINATYNAVVQFINQCNKTNDKR